MVTMTKDELMKMLEAAYEEGSADGWERGTYPDSCTTADLDWLASDCFKAANARMNT